MALSLLLRSADLERSAAFYREVLGFAVSRTAQDTLSVELQGGRILFTQQDLWRGGPVCSGTLYFDVADVDAYYAAVRDRARIAWPLQDMPYGSREFGVVDVDGYHLAFQRRAPTG